MTANESARVGETLDGYRLVAAIGEGGMARVFLALRGEGAGEREFALKVIWPRYARDPTFIRMFLDEGRIASLVQHPNVVSVKGVGDAGGVLYMAMEFLHGVTLATLVGELARGGRRLSPHVAVAIAQRAARGLHGAHESVNERGEPLEIVHRDVSLTNVLLGCGGVVKMIDFGIAKAEGRLSHTAKGMMKGKMRYMAPEQMRRGAVDRRSDVFALGVVLWELLTARRLYGKCSDVDVTRRALAGDHAPPGRHVALPGSLGEVVMRCLSVEADHRFASAAALEAALAAAVPEAASVSDAKLGSLLWAVAGDALDAEAARLPVALPTLASLVSVDPPLDVALEELTVPFSPAELQPQAETSIVREDVAVPDAAAHPSATRAGTPTTEGTGGGRRFLRAGAGPDGVEETPSLERAEPTAPGFGELPD